MKNIILAIIKFLSIAANGQLAIGTYNTHNPSHNNTKHFEELILNPDNTFYYSTRMEFIKISKQGQWHLANDTLMLTENSICCDEKIIVYEKQNKKI